MGRERRWVYCWRGTECLIHCWQCISLWPFLAGIPDEGLGELSTSVMESPGQKQRQFVCTLWLSPYPSIQPFPWVSLSHTHTQMPHSHGFLENRLFYQYYKRIRYEMKIALLQGCTSHIKMLMTAHQRVKSGQVLLRYYKKIHDFNN